MFSVIAIDKGLSAVLIFYESGFTTILISEFFSGDEGKDSTKMNVLGRLSTLEKRVGICFPGE